MATLVVLERARTILLDGKRRPTARDSVSLRSATKRTKHDAEQPYEPPFKSAWSYSRGFRHFSHYYDQVYQGSPRVRVDRAVELTRQDFIRFFLDDGESRGIFGEISERMERDRFRGRPLTRYYSRFGAESETTFLCSWLPEDLRRLRDFVYWRFRFDPIEAEQVWLRFESDLRFGEAVRIVVALAVSTGLMSGTEDFEALRQSPLLVWLMLSVAASCDRSFDAEWTRFYRLMKDVLNHDELAYDLTFLVTLNAYMPYMDERLRAQMSDNGFLEVEYGAD